MRKEGKMYNQHARCSMRLEKQKYIYILYPEAMFTQS